jgi:dihydropteroate synthase
MRPAYHWRLRSRTLTLGPRTLLMGILNVTPDSFSDGGRFLSTEAAIDHARHMLDDGADILDIGGESTRPGARVATANGRQAAGVTADEELRRILPVIAGVKRAVPEALISVDTYKAAVAREAIAAGAEIVNDVSGLRWDPEMPGAVAAAGCGVVLMHTRGKPGEWRDLPPLGTSIVEVVSRELEAWAADAERAGIAQDRLVLDPGFGFGKNFEENYPLLARLDELQRLGYPLLAGPSRKSFIGRTISRTGEPAPPELRLHGTLAAVAAAILKGAHIVRVHDVGPARDVAAVCDEILLFTAEDAEENQADL